MYKSIDGGQLWKEINDGLSNQDWDIPGIFINPEKSDEILIGTLTNTKDNDSIGVFKLMNDSWIPFDNGIPGGVRSFVFDDKNNRLFAYGVGIYFLDSAITFVKSKDLHEIKTYSLYQNYPNPFNPVTRIKYSIPHLSMVKIKVYDLLGREVTTLINKEQSAGNYEIEFNAGRLSSGTYIYELRVNDYSSYKKLMVLK